MKRFIVVLMAFSLFLVANQTKAQTLTWNTYGNTLDTVTNTGVKYATVTIGNTATKAFSIVVKVTKISGTVGGTISWQGSNNGTDFYTISTTSPSDASANYGYAIYTPTAFKYYRVSYAGASTMSASISGAANLVR